jgi:hypothetical protein
MKSNGLRKGSWLSPGQGRKNLPGPLIWRVLSPTYRNDTVSFCIQHENRRNVMAARTRIAHTFAVVLGVASVLGASASANAETLEERQACMGDAFHFCSSAIPDRDQVYSCLMDNRDLISAACRSVIAPDMPVDRASSQKQLPRSEGARASIGRRTWQAE